MGEGRRAMVNAPLPEHWMVEVERRGHGVRVDKALKVKESLAELLASGLRREVGIKEEDWNLVSEGLVDMKTFFMSLEHEGHGLEFREGSLKIGSEKIALLDHILPYLMVALDEIEIQSYC